MFVHNIDPVFLRIGGLEIRYYGLIFAIGFLLVLWLSTKLAEKRKIDKNMILDAAIWTIIGVIVGARFVYVFVYNPMYYLHHLAEIPVLWEGGIAFHGGLLGAIIGLFLFCKKRKMHFYDIADIFLVALPIALALGRVANFINGELVGRVANVPWAVDFGDGLPRHPSQLYESFKNFVLFFIMFSASKIKNLKRGTLFWLFVLLYGLFRFMIEFFRAPDPQLGFIIFGLTMGQLFCSAMVIAALTWFVRNRSR